MYIPAQEMGDYEEKRPKKKSSGALYPLDEEGTYGRPPSQASRYNTNSNRKFDNFSSIE